MKGCLACHLRLHHCKGFSRSNLTGSGSFTSHFQNGATLSHHLSWSHVVELLKIDDSLERAFYQQQAISEHWSVRELQRKKENLAIS